MSEPPLARRKDSLKSLTQSDSWQGHSGPTVLPSGFGGLLLLWCAVSVPLLSWMILSNLFLVAAVVGCFMLVCLVFAWSLVNYRQYLFESNRLLLLETELSGLMYRSIKIANAASSFEEATADVCAEICKTTHWLLVEKPVTSSPGARMSFVIDKNLPYDVEYTANGSQVSFQILTSIVVIASMTFATQNKIEARVVSAVKVIFSQLASVYHREHSIAVLEESYANLTHATKMASLGEMAGGIAHEINNPLQILHAYITRIEACLQWGEPSEKIEETCRRMLSTIDRISKIIKALQVFARNGQSDPLVSYSAKKIIDETAALAADRIRSSGIHLKTSAESANMMLSCRPTEVGQILLNLISNACDAVNESVDKEVEMIVRKTVNGFCEFSVIDSGLGVAPENIRKIMQPFFTTKPTGQGTGLGLSISRGIAQGHGGDLYYQRTNGRTQFSFTIPAII